METEPNARVLDEDGKPIAYTHVGPSDNLKVMFKAARNGGWIDYSSDAVCVWLNGQPLTTLQELVFRIDEHGMPTVKITLNLEEIDIDADSLTALEAIVKQQESSEKQTQSDD